MRRQDALQTFAVSSLFASQYENATILQQALPKLPELLGMSQRCCIPRYLYSIAKEVLVETTCDLRRRVAL